MLTPFPKGPLSVQELSLCLKQQLQDAFPWVAVYGEISNLRTINGHCWFTLKDAASRINAVLFKSNATALNTPFENGQCVVIEGRIDLYIASGRYQIIVKTIRKLGLGELQQQFEVLKAKLRDEGLFAPDTKRTLPTLPKTIGLITSPEAAALHDFIHILQRKQWKGKVLLAPALVQGHHAPKAMMRAFQQLQRNPAVELIVLIRGGGSLEDLQPFNQETLVRFLAKRQKPLLTGIGHEIDYTLCDFVADKRAETPTAAAEIIANPYQNAIQQLTACQKHCRHLFASAWISKQQNFRYQTERFGKLHPQFQLQQHQQKLEQITNRFRMDYQQPVNHYRQQFAWLILQLQRLEPIQPLRNMQKQLCETTHNLHRIFQQRFAQKMQQTDQWHQRLQALSIEHHLRRGFLIPIDANGSSLKTFSPHTHETQWVWHRRGKFPIQIVPTPMPTSRDPSENL